jgi:hypothetical protein
MVRRRADSTRSRFIGVRVPPDQWAVLKQIADERGGITLAVLALIDAADARRRE